MFRMYKRSGYLMQGNRSKNIHWEDDLQIQVATYLRLNYPAVKFTISPANIKLTKFMAKKVKSMGYGKGTPDLIIPARNAQFSGLWIELKSERKEYKDENGENKVHEAGTASSDQLEWLAFLTAQGYKALVCTGYEEAKAVIDNYFRG
jgi:hypothetical protein